MDKKVRVTCTAYRIILFSLINLLVGNQAVWAQVSPQSASSANLQAEKKQKTASDRIVETSYLPITLKYQADLSSHKVAGMGGSLYVNDSGVLLMDRTGKFYSVRENVVTELEFRTPSGYDLFLQEFPEEKIKPGVINATSFIYDSESKKIYAAHNQYIGDDQIRMMVSSIEFDANALKLVGEKKWKSVFEGQSIRGETLGTDASAGKLLHVENDLLLTTGFPGHEDAKGINEVIQSGSLALTPPQNMNSLHSKIIKISLKDHSFEIFARGQRNSQGMVLTSNGEILSTDHGPQGGDEINRIRRDGNYGHPIHTFGTRYGSYDYAWPEQLTNLVSKDQKFDLPIYAFVPSIAINPIIEIKTFNQRYLGDLLVGSLKAQSLYRLKYSDGRVIFAEPIWIGHRIRDIYEYKDKIYLLTDDPHLISLETNTDKLKSNKTKDDKYFLSETMQKKCLVCHSFNPTLISSPAPTLSNIIGKKFGTDGFERYSAGFKNSNLTWTQDNLKAYLKNPAALVPGTTMPNPNLKENEIDEIVQIINAYK